MYSRESAAHQEQRSPCPALNQLKFEKVASAFLKENDFCSSQVNGWDMTMVTHDQARKRLTKKNEDVVRLLVTRRSLEEAVKHSMGSYPRQ